MAKRFAVLGSVVVGVMGSSAYAQPGATAPAPPAPTSEVPPPSEAPPAPQYAPPIEAPGAPPARELSMAEKLTLGARNASRDGRCDAIAMIGARVRQLDPAYYQNVFVVDPTIANCRQGVVFRPPSREPVYAAPPPVAQPVEVDPLPSEIIEVKSPGKALALSLGVTAGGLGLMVLGSSLDHGSEKDGETFATLGSLAFLIGPTVGHVYAGNTWNTGLKWRLASLGISVGGLVYALSQCGILDDCTDEEMNGADVGAAVAVGGMISFFGATIYEVATAPSSARQYNLEYTRYRMNVRPHMQIVPMAGRAPGFSLAGTF
ncbi:MAG: hypothetical protein HOV81_35155 [Kofleriaceae bacterium]|nr:hypothetical protein [Kofleriaceae bacterium]